MNRAQDEGPSTPTPPGRRSGTKLGRTYQAAFEATVAVVVAAAAGGFADQRFGTAPVLLITGVLLGFGAFVLRLVRLLRELERGPQGLGGSDDDDAGPPAGA